jgi:hypothetical protein
LKGTKKMKSQELFAGFDPKQQAKHEQYLIDRFGEGMKEGIAQSKRKVKHWTKADWEKSGAAFAAICKDLVALMGRQLPADSREAQAVIRRHYEWLKQFWTPNRESYAGHSQLMLDSDLRKAYEAYAPGPARVRAAAMKIFAERTRLSHEQGNGDQPRVISAEGTTLGFSCLAGFVAARL